MRITRISTTLATVVLLGSLASAQFSTIGPFTGTDSEGFDYQTASGFPTCVVDRVFYNKADLCGLNGGYAHITGGWTFACAIGPNNTPRLFGSNNVAEYTFDDYVTKFGGYFGINHPGAPDGKVEFYDDAGTLLHSQDIAVPSGCTWHWHGWDTGGVLVKSVRVYGNYSNNGRMLMDDMEADITAGQVYPEYCTCEQGGTNTAPCGNFNDATAPLGGCRHDDSNAGAHLSASGVASVTADTLVLSGARGPISNSSLFFQAVNNLDGSGTYLDDGIQCAGGSLVRLGVRNTDGSGNADTSGYAYTISARSASFGDPLTAGTTRYYQWWIRDPGGSPCGNDANTSNGVEVTWGP